MSYNVTATQCKNQNGSSLPRVQRPNSNQFIFMERRLYERLRNVTDLYILLIFRWIMRSVFVFSLAMN
ncbi:10760_t:CDS:2 [Dentiscutata erythropus]|uniref:10760_t:CDS:1 n=1 Tax=Dentiscutata erythropus TaxID=1348616 RepID=A0A9N9GJF8_9GLOM|nr:10760_t:CDS:2 [Dentiscutata erythropus]